MDYRVGPDNDGKEVWRMVACEVEKIVQKLKSSRLKGGEKIVKRLKS